MLSSVAVLDIFSVGICVMVTEKSFCSSTIVGLNLSKKFLSSTNGSEVAVILLAGDPNAAIKIEMGRIPGLTHKSTEYK